MGKIKVLVVGAAGRMGTEVVKAVLKEPDLVLVGAVDEASVGKDAGLVAGAPEIGLAIEADLSQALKSKKPDVAVDFTHHDVALEHLKLILKNGVRPVIGTSGIKEKNLDDIKKIAQAADLPVIIAPNFAVGAVLMMRTAAEIAKYMPHVEIIEMHHDQKADAPSGTALKTADLILESAKINPPRVKGKETMPNVLGGETGNIRIHSVRLPGLVAHQEIIFGGEGQTLTLRHDSISRESFMPGVILAIHRIMQEKGVIYGLENLL